MSCMPVPAGTRSHTGYIGDQSADIFHTASMLSGAISRLSASRNINRTSISPTCLANQFDVFHAEAIGKWFNDVCNTVS